LAIWVNSSNPAYRKMNLLDGHRANRPRRLGREFGG
jgi:hypothetical protein